MLFLSFYQNDMWIFRYFECLFGHLNLLTEEKNVFLFDLIKQSNLFTYS